MVRLISRQHGGLAALKLTKLFGIDDFPAAKDSGKVLIIIIYCYLIIIIIRHYPEVYYGLTCTGYLAPSWLHCSVHSYSIVLIPQRSWVRIPFKPEFFQALISQLLKLCV